MWLWIQAQHNLSEEEDIKHVQEELNEVHDSPAPAPAPVPA
jgi:hypothetical protein